MNFTVEQLFSYINGITYPMQILGFVIVGICCFVLCVKNLDEAMIAKVHAWMVSILIGEFLMLIHHVIF